MCNEFYKNIAIDCMFMGRPGGAGVHALPSKQSESLVMWHTFHVLYL